MHIKLFLVATFTVLTSFEASALSEGTYQLIVKKQEEKKSSRWTLADWLAWKERARQMDLWLARNSSSSPFEFFLETSTLGFNEAQVSSDATVLKSAYQASLGAYAGLAGLKAAYEYREADRAVWLGSFNLRIWGRALQDTHINLEYGIRGDDRKNLMPSETIQNQFAGVSTALYLTKYFGFDGSYRRLLPSSSGSAHDLDGEISQAGVFIDFSALRIFGTWRKEVLRLHRPGADPSSAAGESSEGFGGGLRLFF